MKDLDAFLDAILPRLEMADTALHNGDARARAALWSHDDPVTLFGAAVTTTGWEKVGATFEEVFGQAVPTPEAAPHLADAGRGLRERG